MGQLVDDSGNPINAAAPAVVASGTLVDDNGLPLSHAAVARQAIQRYPGDPISKIQERKAHPPPTAHGDPNAREGLTAQGGVLAAERGVGADPQSLSPANLAKSLAGESDTEAEELGIPPERMATNPPTAAGRQKQEESLPAIAARVKAAPTVTGKLAAAADTVPILGPTIHQILKPAVASSEHRAVTPQENEEAITGATTAATMLVPPLLKGGTPRAAAEAPVAEPAPELPVRATDMVQRESYINRIWDEVQNGDPANRELLPQPVLDGLKRGEIKGPADIGAALDKAYGKAVPVGKAATPAPEPPVPDNVVPMPQHATEPPASSEHGGTLVNDSGEPLAASGPLMASFPLDPAPAVDLAKRHFAPVKEMVDAVNPAGASPEAAGAADILRRSKAEIANDATVERYRNRAITKQFERTPDAENIGNISEYERTGQFKNTPPGYSEMYRETTDAAHKTLQEVYGDDRVGYVDNYVRRAFKFATKGDEARASGALSNWIGSLSADTSPLKGRVLSVPLDQALQTMRNAGIDVKMATTNPELLRQWTVENANQARVYKQAWTDAKDGGLIQFVKQGERMPSGSVVLDDRVAKVFRPTDEGMVQTGRYVAEPGVARIFNNAISKGLGGSPTFRGIRAINNAYNQMQLGFSAFHLTGTAINASVSDVGLGIQKLLGGDVAGAAKSIGRGAVPGASFLGDMFNGRKFINDLVANDPAARGVLEEKLNPAGGRLGIEQAYRNTAADNMARAWANRRFHAVLGNAPLAIVQKMASPLMEYAIPRVKLGAFLDLADTMREQLGPNADAQAIQRAYEKAWDSIDNRFGQLVHDNLFWNRTAADLAQVSTRSVGWNLGTVRELGGGVVDLAKGDVRSPRVAYSFALPVVAGTIGALYQYLHTGKGPETLRDYYYPQNGLKDSRGRDDRVALPTYMKDVYAYSDHPVATLEHKASPLLSMAADLGTNRDYFGDMIRNPDDTTAKQWQQNGAYMLRQLQPFSIQQARNTGSKPQAIEQFFGFTKAPAEMKMTPEQSEAARNRRRVLNDVKMQKAAAKHGG